jgi:hypothetical protein
VNGSLSSNTIIFNGLGSSLLIDGCVYLSDGITIDLDQATQSEGPITIIEQKGGSNCSFSVSDIGINIKEPKSCKRTEVKKDEKQSGPSRLVLLFSINSSRCNVKWIILGSILGGLLLIGIITTTILAYQYSPSFKKAVSPFSSKK